MSQPVNRDDYVAVSPGGIRCVDDRGDLTGENLSIQLPGAGLHLVDLLRLALAHSQEETTEAVLWEMAQDVLASAPARQYGISGGVHIDDEHGHLTDPAQLQVRNSGCGYDSVRLEVLGRLESNIPGYQAGTHIKKAKDTGWNVQILTGEHHSEATAAINYLTGQTLWTKSLWEEGRVPSFNYDIWAVEALKPMLVSSLEQHDLPEAAAALEDNALKWGEKLYLETLDILTKGRLGAHNLIKIQ